jgi:hypothetical protein
MTDISNGSVLDEEFVALSDLKDYLSSQYGRRMNGAAIARHKFFGRRFTQGKDGGVTIVSGDEVLETLIPIDEVADYLTEQYAGMGGGDIASHRYFMRHCPSVTL